MKDTCALTLVGTEYSQYLKNSSAFKGAATAWMIYFVDSMNQQVVKLILLPNYAQLEQCISSL